jgi:hypothetical protein
MGSVNDNEHARLIAGFPRISLNIGSSMR